MYTESVSGSFIYTYIYKGRFSEMFSSRVQPGIVKNVSIDNFCQEAEIILFQKYYMFVRKKFIIR